MVPSRARPSLTACSTSSTCVECSVCASLERSKRRNWKFNAMEDGMVATVEVDDSTFSSLEFAARMARTTAGDVVARLVAQASVPALAAPPSGANGASTLIRVYACYDGHRAEGTYDPDTTRIDITSGPLAGRSFKTPTAAARAVVAHYKPGISPNRNGWLFWILDDGSGRFLRSIRRS